VTNYATASPTNNTVSLIIGQPAIRARTSPRACHGATPARAGGTSWRSTWRHDVQAAPGAPRGLKPLVRFPISCHQRRMLSTANSAVS
jgi:hypothetical protein